MRSLFPRAGIVPRLFVLTMTTAVLGSGAGPAIACGQPATPPPGALDAAYADRAGSGVVVAWPLSGGASRPLSLDVGCAFRISPVGDVPGFAIPIRPRDPVAPTRAGPPLSGKVFVMADTHGEYAIAVRMLHAAGVIDQDMSWAYGAGAVVVLGDVLDRGAHQTEILWLLYKLQGEAEAVGGQLHLLLGNHETMVLTGDLRYLNAKYPRVADSLAKRGYADVLGPATVLGEWLRTRAAVLQIGTDLFVHGGISPAFAASGTSLEEANDQVRSAIAGPSAGSSGGPVLGADGPLWYRGYIAYDGVPVQVTTEQVESLLSRFGATRIFVGHTIVPAVSSAFGGRVIAVQVYPHLDDEGAVVMESVVIENGAASAIDLHGERRLQDERPGGSSS